MRTAPGLRVYFVANAGLCEDAGHAVRETVIAAVKGGTACVQLRAKDSDGRPFLEEVLEVMKVVGKKVPVIVSDRVDMLLAACVLRAQVVGVHVGQSDLPAPLVRILIDEDAYLGLSVGTQEEAQAAREEGAASHVGLSTLRTTTTKTDTPDILGFEGYERLKGIVGIPVIAIGRVGVDDMAQLAQIDIDKGTIVSTICCAPDPAVTATQLLTQRNKRAQE